MSKKIILYEELPPLIKSVFKKIDDTKSYGAWRTDMDINMWIESMKMRDIEMTEELKEELMPYVFGEDE